MPNRRKQYPYFERYPNQDLRCSFYAFYREEGLKKRLSLKTRNERLATKKFNELCERLEKGILGFSINPKPLLFPDFAKHYLEEGTSDLAPASIDRHRQNLFGLRKLENGSDNVKRARGHLVTSFGNRNFKSIGVKDIARYIRHRQKAAAAPNTIYKELATVSAMFEFALQEEIVLFNPVLAVKKPKLKLVRPNYTPSRDELSRIIESLFPGAWRFFLSYCNSGCRKSELTNCNVRDADLKQRTLRVVGKGKKERLIYMNRVLEECINQELSLRRNAKPDEPLFLNREGTRYRSLRTPLTRACKLAGVPHMSHHSLRHAYATLQYERGVDVIPLSKLLGHATPTVTQNIYVHLNEHALRQASEGFHIGHLGTQKGQKRGN